jgi:putative lipoprotein
VTILKYIVLMLLLVTFQFSFAQDTGSQTIESQTTGATPWQRLEYLCAENQSLSQIIAGPGQMTLIFGTLFYPMKQVDIIQDTNAPIHYVSGSPDTTLEWILEKGEGKLLQDGTVLAQGCVLRENANAATSETLTPASVSYTCKDNILVNVQYLNDVAQIDVIDPTYGDQAYELPKTDSVSGVKFSNDSTTWFVQGEDANLFEETEEVQHAEDCKLVATMNASTKTLTGTVTYLLRVALPENAVLQIQLQDVSLQDVAATVLAEQTIETKGQQVPIPFSLSYDVAKLEPNRIYALSVRITVAGKLRWINDEQVRVLSGGYPSNNVGVRMIQVQ